MDEFRGVAFSILAFALAALQARAFSRPNSRLYLLDHPNERSLHSAPTPRTGGIAVVTAVYGVGLLANYFIGTSSRYVIWLGVSGLLVAGVSLIDDRVGVSPALRIVVHLLAAAILLLGGFVLTGTVLPNATVAEFGAVAASITLLYIVWMVNLYNFMDGMDGLAGGMTVIGFGTFAVFGWEAGDTLYATLCLVVAASAAGFLVFNFPPARIFMGDTGSSTLGLFAAAFTVWGVRESIFPFWAGLLVFSLFVVDASVTLVRRLARRERIWEAHKTHYYQRVVQLGWGHKKTALWAYVLMLLCSVSAVLAVRQPRAVQWTVIAVWAVIYVGLALLVRRLEAVARVAN